MQSSLNPFELVRSMTENRVLIWASLSLHDDFGSLGDAEQPRRVVGGIAFSNKPREEGFQSPRINLDGPRGEVSVLRGFPRVVFTGPDVLPQVNQEGAQVRDRQLSDIGRQFVFLEILEKDLEVGQVPPGRGGQFALSQAVEPESRHQSRQVSGCSHLFTPFMARSASAGFKSPGLSTARESALLRWESLNLLDIECSQRMTRIYFFTRTEPG